MMSSCSLLDPASLLAQSAVSIRLGRRVSNCSHTVLAKARRAPLSESNVQGSLKQPSTVASAPVQVFQSVGIEHCGRHAADSGDAPIDCLAPSRHSEPRRRSAVPSRDGALQVAISSQAERTAEELPPALYFGGGPQPPAQHLQAHEQELGPPQPGTRVQQDAHWAMPHSTSASELKIEPPFPLGSTAAEISSPHLMECCHQQEQQQRLEQRRPRHVPAAPEMPGQPEAQASTGHVGLSRSNVVGSPQEQPLPMLLRSRQLADDWGQGAEPVMPSGDASPVAASVTLIQSDGDAAVSPATASFARNGVLSEGVHTFHADPLPSRASPSSATAAVTQSVTGPAAAAVATIYAGAATVRQQANVSSAPLENRLKNSDSIFFAGTGVPADGIPSAPPPPPPPPPGRFPSGSDGPSGGQWGGLQSELVTCRSVHSVQRFLLHAGPQADGKLLGNAVIHLSHLAAEEPPDGVVERQLLAGLLDDLTRRLRGSVRQLSHGRLAALICAMSRLCCYDGQLLREAAAAARQVAAELSTRQSAGFLWAFGRYHRDFGFRLEPGWSAALLHAALPRLPKATSQEAAMMLYGCALQGEPPPAAALAELLAASLAGMPAAGGPELSMSIWALATLRLYPGREWMTAFLERCDAATRTFASGAAVSNVLYGLAAMRVQPPAPWMLHFLWQAQRRMNSMDAQSLVMLAWALGRMRYRPDRKWLTRFFRHTRSTVLQQPRDPHIHMRGASQEQLAAQLPSRAVLQAASQRQLELWRGQRQRLQQRLQQPHQSRAGIWGNAAGSGPSANASSRRAGGEFEAGYHSGSAAMPPQSYNLLLWACVRLSCRPMGRWLPLLCDAVQPRLASWPPHELAALLWGLARLSWRPRDDWMTEFFAAARGGLPRFQPADCVMVLLALSRLCSGLGYRASDGDLANALAQRLAPFYQRLQTTTLISVVLAVARVTPRVRPARLEEALAALLERVQAIGVEEQMAALAQVAATAAPAPALAGTGAACVADAHAPSFTAARDAASPLHPQPQPQHEGKESELRFERQMALPSSHEELSRGPDGAARTAAPASATPLPALTARECANAVFAVGSVALWPGYNDAVRSLCGQLLRELLPRAFRLTSALNGVDLVLLIHGVAMSRVRVSPQWLRRHEEQALRRLRAGELHPAQLRELLRAYHALDYAAELLPAPGSGLGAGVPEPEPGSGPGMALADGADSRSSNHSVRAVAVAAAAAAAGDGGIYTAESKSEAEGGNEEESENRAWRAAALSEAAKSRRRRAARGRRRRITAAIKRRVAQARRMAAEAGRGLGAAQQQLPRHDAATALQGNAGNVEGKAGDADDADVRTELEAAERELRLRLSTIRRFTAASRRGRRPTPQAVASHEGS